MNKQDFINQLRTELNGLMQSDIDDIIRDQEEYFREALSKGRDEAAVVSSLGDPSTLAKELKAEYHIRAAVQTEQKGNNVWSRLKSISKAVLALCVLAPFNLIVVLGPFIAVCATLFAFWVVDAVVGVLSLAGLLVSIALIFMVSPMLGVTGLFGSITGVGFTLLAFCGIYFVTTWFLKAMISFLKWNINFVTGAAK